jgi:hypothetical protein
VAAAYHQLLASTDYLYLVGGVQASPPALSALNDPLSSTQDVATSGAIYSTQIDLLDGSFVGYAGTTVSPWSQQPASFKPREKFGAMLVGGYVLVSGGLTGGTLFSSEEEYAAFDPNVAGSIGPFNGATGSKTIYQASGATQEFYNHGAVSWSDANGIPRALVIGGSNGQASPGGPPYSAVWLLNQ